MRKRRFGLGRFIRFTKWAGMCLLVVVVCVWVASGWYHASICVRSKTFNVMVFVGTGNAKVWLYMRHGPELAQVMNPRLDLRVGRRRARLSWADFWPRVRVNPLANLVQRNPPLSVMIPFWLIALMLAIPTVILWRLDRRVPPGRCRMCRYDLTGNVSGVCPECGTDVKQP